MKKLFSLFFILILITSPGVQAQPFSPTDKARILYVGDSIANETKNVVGFFTFLQGNAEVLSSVALTGIETGITEIYPATIGGHALCDFLENEPQSPDSSPFKLGDFVQLTQPDLVVLSFHGNDGIDHTFDHTVNEQDSSYARACMANSIYRYPPNDNEPFYNKYFWGALKAMLEVEQAAITAGIPVPKVLWALQGPFKDDEPRAERLNGIYQFAADYFGGGVTDAGLAVSRAFHPLIYPDQDRYRWMGFLPCTDFEWLALGGDLCTEPTVYGGVTRLHDDNDPWHFTLVEDNNGLDPIHSPGLYRFGLTIVNDIIDELDL